MRALLMLFLLNGATPARTSPTADPQAWSRHAEDELDALDELARGPRAEGAWRRLHTLYRECPKCCEHSASESLGWIPATLLAQHWNLRTELLGLARTDPEWFDFVLKSLHGPADPKLLRRAAENMSTCPMPNRQVCKRIKANALQAVKDIEAAGMPSR